MIEKKPLFIPLKREFYDAFLSGEKTEEFRRYGARWNESTCAVGRPVTISMGYGKAHRRTGTVTGFRKAPAPLGVPAGWIACYGGDPDTAACIRIELTPAQASRE